MPNPTPAPVDAVAAIRRAADYAEFVREHYLDMYGGKAPQPKGDSEFERFVAPTRADAAFLRALADEVARWREARKKHGLAVAEIDAVVSGLRGPQARSDSLLNSAAFTDADANLRRASDAAHTARSALLSRLRGEGVG